MILHCTPELFKQQEISIIQTNAPDVYPIFLYIRREQAAGFLYRGIHTQEYSRQWGAFEMTNLDVFLSHVNEYGFSRKI